MDRRAALQVVLALAATWLAACGSASGADDESSDPVKHSSCAPGSPGSHSHRCRQQMGGGEGAMDAAVVLDSGVAMGPPGGGVLSPDATTAEPDASAVFADAAVVVALDAAPIAQPDAAPIAQPDAAPPPAPDAAPIAQPDAALPPAPDASIAQPDAAAPLPDASVAPDAGSSCTPAVATADTGFHNPGLDCTNCHNGAVATLWTLSGTLYDGVAGANPVAGATIHVLDATGRRIDLITALNGNFYTSQAVAYPVTVSASLCPSTVPMIESVASGAPSCNGCHGSGFRVHVP
jgi:hypothetical protein